MLPSALALLVATGTAADAWLDAVPLTPEELALIAAAETPTVAEPLDPRPVERLERALHGTRRLGHGLYGVADGLRFGRRARLLVDGLRVEHLHTSSAEADELSLLPASGYAGLASLRPEGFATRAVLGVRSGDRSGIAEASVDLGDEELGGRAAISFEDRGSLSRDDQPVLPTAHDRLALSLLGSWRGIVAGASREQLRGTSHGGGRDLSYTRTAGWISAVREEPGLGGRVTLGVARFDRRIDVQPGLRELGSTVLDARGGGYVGLLEGGLRLGLDGAAFHAFDEDSMLVLDARASAEVRRETLRCAVAGGLAHGRTRAREEVKGASFVGEASCVVPLDPLELFADAARTVLFPTAADLDAGARRFERSLLARVGARATAPYLAGELSVRAEWIDEAIAPLLGARIDDARILGARLEVEATLEPLVFALSGALDHAEPTDLYYWARLASRWEHAEAYVELGATLWSAATPFVSFELSAAVEVGAGFSILAHLANATDVRAARPGSAPEIGADLRAAIMHRF